MEPTDTDVDAFLAGLDGEHSDTMRTLDAVIADVLRSTDRVLWEGVFWGGTEQQIIGYGGITQPRPRGKSIDWFLIGLARQQHHVSVYVNAAEGGGYLVKQWAARLGTVKVGSAAITVASLDALDLVAFRAMLERARDITPDIR